MNSYATSQFNYCPLVWMCYKGTLNNKSNRVHERVLKIGFNDHRSSFKQLLVKDHSFSIHEKNLQYLAVETFKVNMGLFPVTMRKTFQ